MKQSNWLPCALSGAAAGFVNGFFGAGGGMLLVPLLIRLAKLEDRTAFSSSVCIVLPMCLVSIAVYAASGMLPVREALPYLAGGAAPRPRPRPRPAARPAAYWRGCGSGVFRRAFCISRSAR